MDKMMYTNLLISSPMMPWSVLAELVNHLEMINIYTGIVNNDDCISWIPMYSKYNAHILSNNL